MATQYIPIGGLWERKTARGPVLSAQVNPAVRKKLMDALAVDELYEIVVFVNDRRDKANSPTHNLCLAVSGKRPSGEAPEAAQTPDRGATGQPATFPAGSSPSPAAEPDLFAAKWPERGKKAPPADEDLAPF